MTTETVVERKSPAKQKRAAIQKQLSAAHSFPLYLDLPLPGETAQVPEQSSSDYRTVSQKSVYYPQGMLFNSQVQTELRKLTISGMKLVWDYNDAVLSALSGQQDLAHVVIVADTIEINMPLSLPQARLEIHARELIFAEGGSIDVTPIGYLPGIKPGIGFEKDDTGHYSGLAGAAGMDAQAIELNVKTLYIPETDEQSVEKRLIAGGARGQDGGVGGLLDLKGKPLTSDKLAAYYEQNKATLAPPAIAWDSVSNTIKNHKLAAFPIPIPIPIKDGKGFRFEGKYSDNFSSPPQQVVGKHVLHYEARVNMPFGSFYVLHWGFQLPTPSKQNPKAGKPLAAHGLDAYAYGKPGRAGHGGHIRFSGQLASRRDRDEAPFSTTSSTSTCSKTIHDISDVSAGEQGESPVMKGEPPVLNKPAIHVKLTVGFRKKTYRTARKPGYATHIIPVRKLEIENVTPRHGLDAAPAPPADAGDDGQVTHELMTSGWLHEFNGEAALTYAKHACMLHNRELARQVVQSYLAELQNQPQPLPPRLASLKHEFNTLLKRLDTDLDIFGNQYGWVPHLSVLGSFGHFKMLGVEAIKTMYLCERMKQKWDVKESKLDYLSATRQALDAQLDKARSTLINGHKEFAQTRQQLQDEFQNSAALLGECAGLEEEIKTQAEIDEQNRAYRIGQLQIGFGTLKVVTGGLGLLTQVIPVGQPVLGMVGNIGSKALGGMFGMVENAAMASLEKNDTAPAGTASLSANTAAQMLKDYQDSISQGIAYPFNQKLDRELKATQKQLAMIGKETASLAKDKESLLQLLALPEDKIPEQLERLFRLQQTTDSVSFKVLAPKEQKELANWLRQKITERISVLESDTKQTTDIIKALRSKGEQADALTSKAAKLAKDKQKTQATIKTVVQGVAQMSDDAQDIFKGIKSLSLSKEDLQPKIAAQIEKLKGSVYADRFSDLYFRITVSGDHKEELLRRLERCQQAIQTAAGTLQSSVVQMNSIDHQALELSAALEHSIYSSLLSLEQEARAVLLEQLYYFGKAYQYRFLKKVESAVPDYYKLDIFLDKFRQFLQSDTAQFEEHLDEIYDMLFAKLQSLVKFLIKDVQHNRLTKQKTRTIHARELMDEQSLQKLNTPLPGQSGKQVQYQPVVINFIDAGFARPDAIKFRIADIELVSVEIDNVEQFSQGLNFEFNFVHSGRSILYDGDKYYLFRAQTPAEKTRWDFTLGIDSKGNLQAERAKDSPIDIQLLQSLCGSNAADTSSNDLLHAYMPGGAADISLYRTSAGNIVGGEITDFTIKVIFEELHAA